MPSLHTAGRAAAFGSAATGGAAAIYVGLVTGALHLDLGLGRTRRPLGPQVVHIAAPREVVFDVVAQPYLGRATRAMQEKVQVVERGDDMVLAVHHTPVHGRLSARTVETVRFTRPERVDFRVVRGPVPYVVETFLLTEQASGTRLTYEGEMAADLWGLGSWWSAKVGARWEEAVAGTFTSIRAEAERLQAVADRRRSQ
jgi:hypothetical protein